MVLNDPLFFTHRRLIVALAAQSRLPAIYGEGEFIEAGGLMFYGATLATMYREAAVYADKILKGAKPAEIPVEQPTKWTSSSTSRPRRRSVSRSPARSSSGRIAWSSSAQRDAGAAAGAAAAPSAPRTAPGSIDTKRVVSAARPAITSSSVVKPAPLTTGPSV